MHDCDTSTILLQRIGDLACLNVFPVHLPGPVDPSVLEWRSMFGTSGEKHQAHRADVCGPAPAVTSYASQISIWVWKIDDARFVIPILHDHS